MEIWKDFIMTRHIARHMVIRKQPGLPLMRRRFIVIGGGLLVLLVVFFVVRASLQEPYVPEVTGKPSAVIDQTYFDYGTVRNGSWAETTFKVKNVGDQQLLIIGEPQVEAVTGCCPPKTTLSQKFLNPGEVATVSMRFSMHEGMDGEHEFRVHVRTTDPVNPDQQVVVLSNWVQQ
ncbi:MAG: DUF1573 domain-containing protein [Anaerolineaceae bacterium]|jgi:hypothetical protein|nr:DUF1573 domain-containing protein [Anaerolineaceae bacterium]